MANTLAQELTKLHDINWGGRGNPTDTGIRAFEKSVELHPDWPAVLSEGDSWFSYPNSGITLKLRKMTKFSHLRHERAGDKAREALSVRQRIMLERHLKKYELDAVMISIGGNDVMGEEFCLVLDDYAPNMTPADVLNDERIDRLIGTIRESFEDVITLRDRHNPGATIITHGYDYAVPNGKKAFKILGPWLLPSLVYRGVPKSKRFGVVKAVLHRFGAMLEALEKETDGFVYVRTQGTLKPQRHWANETHPTDQGFKRLAELFVPVIEKIRADKKNR